MVARFLYDQAINDANAASPLTTDVQYPEKLQNNPFSDMRYADTGGVHPPLLPPNYGAGMRGPFIHPMIDQPVPNNDWRYDNTYIHNKYGLPEYQGELTGRPHRGDISGRANLQEFGTEHYPITPDKSSFKFPSILNMVTEGLGKFRDKFLPGMSPEKQAEVAALGINPDKYGWGTLPGSGLKGQIHNDKIYVENPFGGNLLHGKNVHGSNRTIGDMLKGKEDWAGGQFEKYGDTWTDKDHKGISEALYNYYKSTGALQKWQKAAMNKRVNTTTVDDMIIDGITGDTTGGSHDVSHYDPSAGGASHMTRSQSQGGLGLTQSEAQSISDANRAEGMSGWGLARGGRVSYFDGGLAGLL